MKYATLWMAGFVFLTILDGLVLSFVLGPFFRAHLQPFLRFENGLVKINVAAALVVWALLSAGLVGFVLPRLASFHHFSGAMMVGAAFGAVVYGIFDFTNMAILRGWPLKVVGVDMAWGAVLCSAASTLLYVLDRRFFDGT
ncbi:MAG TPA: DUF2177 family protein [Candidatus Hydrogenedentes bacterium]|nr:DUF2177 family protein [Candidatus Hydrogenedentota bacterium]HOT50025.1 DUF2177 family protein [Candidatus Hydrogenedentota bacterium]HOV74803.1 DUF2177 family protein [Candidatus Hydrogenedentota bacterium]HPC16848.1 DUF2177 family protein [Candidatus Hydrogenedentota bacterium]HRT21329.1 DUF2177 family protein [Candidatus Hydrogenedentota bacterium]